MIQTKCHHCIFKVDYRGKQIDCELGRLSKFMEAGVAVLNDNEESYTINKLCSACRHQSISNKYDNPKEEVLKEIACKFTVIVDHLDGKEFDLDSIKKEQPHQVIFVCKQESVAPLFKEISTSLYGTGIRFEVINFLDDVPTMNTILKKVKGDHIIESNYLPEGVLARFNKTLTDDLQTYIYYHGEIDIVSAVCYKLMSPNKQEVLDYIRKTNDSERFLCEELPQL